MHHTLQNISCLENIETDVFDDISHDIKSQAPDIEGKKLKLIYKV